MPPDIRNYIKRINDEAEREGFVFRIAEAKIIARESARFKKQFQRDLPSTYIEICKMRDGFTDENMCRLYGIDSLWKIGEEYPAYEGLIDIYESNCLAGGVREDFIEFGNQDGVDPWGWDLRLDRFVRALPNGQETEKQFETFDECFRDLFRLNA